MFKSVAVAMFILANAFFVAAEFALVSIRDTRIEQLVAAQVPGARAVRRLQQALDELLPAVQLGVTLCSLALGWVGEPLVASMLQPWFEGLPHAHIWNHIAAVTLGFAIITYFDVVVGELVPKSLALRRAEALAVAVAPTMLVFMATVRPAVRLLRNSAAVILRGFDIPMTERSAVHSPEELKLMATTARRLGLLPQFQETLIHRAIELDDVPVREIMTPRQKIFSLPSNMTLEEACARVIARHHSRIPVYDDARGPEHIVGVVYSRDLSRLYYFRMQHLLNPRERDGESKEQALAIGASTQAGADGVANTSAQPALQPAPLPELRLSQIMREVLVVPETKSILDLIREFQQRRRHLAVAVDEYGSIVGLVTAEDAVEQLAGEFEDEFDSPSHPVLTTAGGAVLMDGNVNLRDLETQMQWNLPRDGGVETLAGFLLYRLGHIPQVGESVVFEDRQLTVVEMDARRIAKIRVEPISPQAEPAS
ncbi:MAG TPA: hemolysin family protein [Terracidiphilus sp.]|nr:hemolysin family protein [Terracidiphilus sp.]